MIYNIIVAMDKNQGIGKNNKLPWRIPEDLIRFSKLTKGDGNNCIIMGRKTWESLPKPLPDRTNIILSNTLNLDYTHNTPKTSSRVISFTNIKDINAFCTKQKYDIAWVIGGEKVFEHYITMNLAKFIYLTHIDAEYDCDVHFHINLEDCKLLDSDEYNTRNNLKLKYNIYDIK